jgi:hypothetical protein
MRCIPQLVGTVQPINHHVVVNVVGAPGGCCSTANPPTAAASAIGAVALAIAGVCIAGCDVVRPTAPQLHAQLAGEGQGTAQASAQFEWWDRLRRRKGGTKEVGGTKAGHCDDVA